VPSDRKCSLSTCIEPQEIGCNRGFEFIEDCPHWKEGTPQQASETGSPEASGSQLDAKTDSPGDSRQLHLPWTGNSLGTGDIELVTACNRAMLIGVIGPYNSGKTSLLTLIYLLIQHGEQASFAKFAGSWSFIGWENLAAKFRWPKGEAGPRFPPHTSRGAGRKPGLLHLAFRDELDDRNDFLLTDPPGEWFSSWAQNASAEGAEGARWINAHADRFLFLVDREALVGSERGKERDNLRDLARRLSSGLRGRPVAVVWTKSDLNVIATIEEDLRHCFRAEFPNHAEFRVRMRFGDEKRSEVEEPCLRLMEWAFAPAQKPTRGFVPAPVYDSGDLFMAYRGQAAHD
jgi:Double-GTPase 2